MSDKKELDDFWDIDMILPVKKPQTGKKTHTDTQPVSISFGHDSTSGDIGEKIPSRNERARQIIASFEKKTSETVCEYKPDNPNLIRVKVTRWPAKYTFYDRFLSEGRKYLNSSYSEAHYVPFFSYMPQYHQMSIYQLRYYLWWRKNLREGIYLNTDGGYLFLYLYELINISDELYTPQYRLDQMAKLWIAYRDSYPKLDTCIGEWLCDFCLIHRLSPPESVMRIAGKVAFSLSLREFYIDPKNGFSDENLCDYIRSNSVYRYERSSVYPKNKKMFDTHLINAAVYALKNTDSLRENAQRSRLMRMSRDSYSGALCASDVKRRIDIEYHSYLVGAEFKPLFSSLLKYSENKLRAYLHIKSRLSVSDLPSGMKQHIDRYYLDNLGDIPPVQTAVDPRTAAERIRYELYEAKDEKLDISSAIAIEDKSWETTVKLIPEDEIEYIHPPKKEIEIQEQISDDGQTDHEKFLTSLNEIQYDYIKLIYAGKTSEAQRLCADNNIMEFAIQDEINAVCSDITGDIIIEDSEIIGDYRDELKFK